MNAQVRSSVTHARVFRSATGVSALPHRTYRHRSRRNSPRSPRPTAACTGRHRRHAYTVWSPIMRSSDSSSCRRYRARPRRFWHEPSRNRVCWPGAWDSSIYSSPSSRSRASYSHFKLHTKPAIRCSARPHSRTWHSRQRSRETRLAPRKLVNDCVPHALSRAEAMPTPRRWLGWTLSRRRSKLASVTHAERLPSSSTPRKSSTNTTASRIRPRSGSTGFLQSGSQASKETRSSSPAEAAKLARLWSKYSPSYPRGTRSRGRSISPTRPQQPCWKRTPSWRADTSKNPWICLRVTGMRLRSIESRLCVTRSPSGNRCPRFENSMPGCTTGIPP